MISKCPSMKELISECSCVGMPGPGPGPWTLTTLHIGAVVSYIHPVTSVAFKHRT